MPVLDQINLVVRDMDASIAFYRALGLDVPDERVWRTASGAHHVEIRMPGGFELALDSVAMAGVYDSGWRPPGEGGPRGVLTFRTESREEVDRRYAELTGLGYAAAQAPFDAFWGARYAIVEDPDGNHVGLMSRPDDDHRGPLPEI